MMCSGSFPHVRFIGLLFLAGAIIAVRVDLASAAETGAAAIDDYPLLFDYATESSSDSDVAHLNRSIVGLALRVASKTLHQAAQPAENETTQVRGIQFNLDSKVDLNLLELTTALEKITESTASKKAARRRDRRRFLLPIVSSACAFGVACLTGVAVNHFRNKRGKKKEGANNRAPTDGGSPRSTAELVNTNQSHSFPVGFVTDDKKTKSLPSSPSKYQQVTFTAASKKISSDYGHIVLPTDESSESDDGRGDDGRADDEHASQSEETGGKAEEGRDDGQQDVTIYGAVPKRLNTQNNKSNYDNVDENDVL